MSTRNYFMNERGRYADIERCYRFPFHLWINLAYYNVFRVKVTVMTYNSLTLNKNFTAQVPMF